MKMETSKTNFEESQHPSEFHLEISKVSECRICLEVDSGEIQGLVSPCHCAGSLKFVHEGCLRMWISKKVEDSHQNVQNTKAFICCQVCKTRIFFRTSSSLGCKNSTQIKNEFKGHYKLFIALLLLLIINLGFFSALLNYLVFIGFRTLKENNVVLVSLIISGQVIFSIVAVVTLGAIVKRFFLKNYLAVELIPSNNSIIRK